MGVLQRFSHQDVAVERKRNATQADAAIGVRNCRVGTSGIRAFQRVPTTCGDVRFSRKREARLSLSFAAPAAKRLFGTPGSIIGLPPPTTPARTSPPRGPHGARRSRGTDVLLQHSAAGLCHRNAVLGPRIPEFTRGKKRPRLKLNQLINASCHPGPRPSGSEAAVQGKPRAQGRSGRQKPPKTRVGGTNLSFLSKPPPIHGLSGTILGTCLQGAPPRGRVCELPPRVEFCTLPPADSRCYCNDRADSTLYIASEPECTPPQGGEGFVTLRIT